VNERNIMLASHYTLRLMKPRWLETLWIFTYKAEETNFNSKTRSSEKIICLLSYCMDCIENDGSNNSSIVAYVFFAVGMHATTKD
jgi:hypothetical protein